MPRAHGYHQGWSSQCAQRLPQDPGPGLASLPVTYRMKWERFGWGIHHGPSRKRDSTQIGVIEKNLIKAIFNITKVWAGIGELTKDTEQQAPAAAGRCQQPRKYQGVGMVSALEGARPWKPRRRTVAQDRPEGGGRREEPPSPERPPCFQPG